MTGGSHPCQNEEYDSGASSASDSGGSVITTFDSAIWWFEYKNGEVIGGAGVKGR